ncbi:MAG: hypothetical protein R3Y33_04830 [Clostridia bacterium]
MAKKRKNHSFDKNKNVRYDELFSENTDTSNEEAYEKIKAKRKKNLASSLESSSMNIEQLTGEFGFVAPIPISSDDNTSMFIDTDFQNIINQSSVDNKETNDFSNEADEQSINRILQSLNENDEDDVKIYKLTTETKSDEKPMTVKQDESTGEKKVKKPKTSDAKPVVEKVPDTPPENEEVPKKKKKKKKPQVEIKEDVLEEIKPEPEVQLPIIERFPAIRDPRQYRSKILPINIVDINSLQKVLVSEIKKMKNDVKEINLPSRNSVSQLYDNIENPDSDTDDSTSDFRRISSTIRKKIQSSYFNIFLTSFLCAIMFFVTSINEQSYVTGNTEGNPVPYLITSLVIISIAFIASFKNIIKGISSLVSLRPNADSSMAILCLTILIHTSVAFYFPEQILDGSIHVYPFVALLSILFNNVGKVVAYNKQNSTLRFVSSREDKYALQIVGDYGLTRDFAGDSVFGSPVIAYQKKANKLINFQKIAKEPDPSEFASKNLTLLFILASLFLGVLQALINQDVFSGFSVFVASVCVSSSIGNILCVNLIMSRLSKKLRSFGAMINSYYCISELAKVNAVAFSASELFPQGNIHLTDAKTYGNQDPETVLLYAGILANEAGGTLKDIFSQFIREDETRGLKVTSLFFEDGNGVSGEIDKSSILIGNRDLLLKNGIEPPLKEDVIEYTGRGEKVLFIAVNGEFSAMLVLRYSIDRKKITALKDLENRGITILVQSSDSNITQKMLANSFGLYKSSVKILYGQVGEKYEKMIKQTLPKTDALVATKGKSEAMVEIIKDCDIQKKMVSLLVALQCTGSILGFALVVLLSFLGSITHLTALSISLYQLFWLAITIFVPKAKKM